MPALRFYCHFPWCGASRPQVLAQNNRRLGRCVLKYQRRTSNTGVQPVTPLANLFLPGVTILLLWLLSLYVLTRLTRSRTGSLAGPERGALTQIFEEYKSAGVPVIVGKVVADIDAIVKEVR